MTTNPKSTVETRQAQFTARRHDALVEIIQAHPYSSVAVIVALAERDEVLRGNTWVGIERMFAELFVSKRIRRGGTTRQALYSVDGADKVLADRQAERDASGQLERVTVPTAPTSKAAPTTSTDGRQLARLAATTPKIGDSALVVGITFDETDLIDTTGVTLTADPLRAVGVKDEDIVDEAPVAPTPAPATRASLRGQLKPGSSTARMVDHIKEHPYCVAGDIVSALDMSHSIVSTSLKTHSDSHRHPRVSRARGDDGLWRWFMADEPERGAEQLHVNRSTGGNHWRTGVRTETVDPNSATGRLAAWVIANPGYTARQAGDALGIRSTTASTLLALHCKTGRAPCITRTQVGSTHRYSGAEQAGGVDMSRETNATIEVPTSPAVESGIVAPEAPVESDGAGPSEAVPTASEAPSEDLQLVSDLTKRVMELEVQRDALLRANETQERVRTTLQSEISDARDWLSKLTYIGADTPIDIAAKRAVDAARVTESARAAAASELARVVAYIDAARARVLRLLGSQADVEDQSATLDELLTSLEAFVRNLEASCNGGLHLATADRAELTRLARFLERETRKPRQGETPVDTAIRFMLEDAYRLRMVAHLAVGGEVDRA